MQVHCEEFRSDKNSYENIWKLSGYIYGMMKCVSNGHVHGHMSYT